MILILLLLSWLLIGVIAHALDHYYAIEPATEIAVLWGPIYLIYAILGIILDNHKDGS